MAFGWPPFQFTNSGLDFVTTLLPTALASLGVANGSVLVSAGVGVTPVFSASPLLTAVNFGSSVLQLDAADQVAIRNGTTSERLHVYSTYTDASNYTRLVCYGNATGGSPGIGVEGAGSGVNLNFNFGQLQGTGDVILWTNASQRWKWNVSGHLLAVSDNSFDIGAVGATRPRTIYAGTSVIAPLFTTSSPGVATFGPSGVTSITVKGGIVTAIS